MNATWFWWNEVAYLFHTYPLHPFLNKQSSKSNEMLSGLRYFEHALRDDGRGKSKGAFSWGAIDMTSVARCFLNICLKAINVCSSEPRLLEVNSPCYVLGELIVLLRVNCTMYLNNYVYMWLYFWVSSVNIHLYWMLWNIFYCSISVCFTIGLFRWPSR